MVGGCLAVATCVFLAGAFLTADAARAGDTALAEKLRTRTLVVGVVTGAIVFAGLYPDLPRRAHPQRRPAQSCLAASGRGGARRGGRPRAAVAPKLFGGKVSRPRRPWAR